MDDPFINRLRMNERDRDELLDQLDGDSVHPEARARRKHDRLAYRGIDIPVTLRHPGGGVSRFLVCARNLSAGGMSFLHGGCLHVGSKCEVLLRSTGGVSVVVRGGVASCRHVHGMVHEVGIQFHESVDPYDYCSSSTPTASLADRGSVALPSISGRALCAMPPSEERNRLTCFLDATGLEVAVADTLEHALREIAAGACDIVIAALDGSPVSTGNAVGAMRATGFEGPIVRIRDHGRPDGFARDTLRDAALVRPYAPTGMLHLVARMMKSAA